MQSAINHFPGIRGFLPASSNQVGDGCSGLPSVNGTRYRPPCSITTTGLLFCNVPCVWEKYFIQQEPYGNNRRYTHGCQASTSDLPQAEAFNHRMSGREHRTFWKPDGYVSSSYLACLLPTYRQPVRQPSTSRHFHLPRCENSLATIASPRPIRCSTLS